MNTLSTRNTIVFSFWHSAAFQGAFWKVVSCAAFASINVIVRYLSGGSPIMNEPPLPTNVIIFFQNLFGMLFMVPFLFSSNYKGLSLKTHFPKLHLLRIMTAVLGIMLWYLTLKYMNMAEGVALSFTGPIFTVIGAWFFLGEGLTWPRLLAIVISLLGSFVIARPDVALFNSGTPIGVIALLPLGSAVAFAWNKLVTRQLGSRGESAQRLTLYLLLGMAPVSLFPALFDWMMPANHHWPWLILLGVLGWLANIAFAKAYVLAEVTFLAPFGFTKFLFSMALGYYCFSELPSVSLWMGLTMIGLSILLVGVRSKTCS